MLSQWDRVLSLSTPKLREDERELGGSVITTLRRLFTMMLVVVDSSGCRAGSGPPKAGERAPLSEKICVFLGNRQSNMLLRI
jgi:hypothetical protein